MTLRFLDFLDPCSQIHTTSLTNLTWHVCFEVTTSYMNLSWASPAKAHSRYGTARENGEQKITRASKARKLEFPDEDVIRLYRARLKGGPQVW